MQKEHRKNQTSIEIPTKKYKSGPGKGEWSNKITTPPAIPLLKLLSSLPAKNHLHQFKISQNLPTNHGDFNLSLLQLSVFSWTLASILLTKRLKPPASVMCQKAPDFFPKDSPNAGFKIKSLKVVLRGRISDINLPRIYRSCTQWHTEFV